MSQATDHAPAATHPEEFDRRRPARKRSPSPVRTAALVGAISVLITVVVSWAAWISNQHNEQSLLTMQTRQAASVIEAQILDISDPLAATLRIAQATGGDATAFQKTMLPLTGPDRLFVTACLFDVGNPSTGDPAIRLVTVLGAPPLLGPRSEQTLGLARTALSSPTFVVAAAGAGRMERVAYAIADRQEPRFVVYAERAIPANRLVPVESHAAFSDLHFATYLGPAITPAALATTDLPLSALPLTGATATESIPFGDTSLTLVASPRGQLGGPLGWQLPRILLAGGGLLTVLAVVSTARFARRRREAERDADTISGLYTTLDRLYAEQRTLAETLQHALLPRTNPSIPGLEIASRYVAGTGGIDIGGDWYSMIALDGRHFGFVVGDVSGRGISAATVMARLRFTMRAYLLEGHPPATVLEMCSRHLDYLEDGHFATVLVGLGDLDSREVILANAGHLEPLIITGSHVDYAGTIVGTPLGVQVSGYTPTTITMAPGSTLVAFTDGLVERREESIDVGLRRLADAATPAPTLDDFVAGLVLRMTDHASEDDVAVLAFRWHPAPEPG